MLITELTPNKQVAVKCNYSKSYVSRFRMLDTAYFDRNIERWVFDPSVIDDYCELFRGEIVWKTPLWFIKNKPMPDMKAMYEVDNAMQIPASKINLYDYQRFGVRFMSKKLKDFGFVINADDVGLGERIAVHEECRISIHGL